MDWTKKLLEYAPDIAGAIMSGGTTLPALAIKAFKDATGTAVKNEDDVRKVVENITPEMKLKLASANNTFKHEMAKLSNELAYSELADTQHAREQHKLSKMPAIICVTLTIIVAAIVAALFRASIPAGNESTLYLMLGQVLAAWTASVAYWVGTTRSSAQKTIQASIKGG